MKPISALLLLCWILLGSSWVTPASGADADAVTPSGTIDPQTDLTANERSIEDGIYQRAASLVAQAVSGQDPGELTTRMLAAKMRQAGELEDRKASELGPDPSAAGHADILGGFAHADWHLTGGTADDLASYPGPGDTYTLIDGARDHAAGLNAHLQHLANRLGGSHFACGTFDWAAQFRAAFNRDALRNYVSGLSEGVIAAAPMALLANFSPTLYEIVKHLKAIAAVEMTANLHRCEAMEQSLITTGQRLTRGPGYADCMQSHADVGIAEANRICDQGNASPFDGVENAVGQIVSPDVGDHTQIDLTQEIIDGLRPDAAGDGDELVAQKQQELAAAEAAAAAAPDPGTPQPGWGESEYQAYGELSRDRALVSSAQADLDTATLAASSPPGPEAGIRSAIADGMKGVLGDVVLSPDASLTFGQQPRAVWKLNLAHSAFRWREVLSDQLAAHWPLLIAMPPDPVALGASYRDLRAHCWACMQQDWRDPGHPDLVFDDRTLDRLAVIEVLDRAAASSPLGRDRIEARFAISQTLAAISRLEVDAYALEEFDGARLQVMDQVAAMFGGRNGVAGSDGLRRWINDRLADRRRELDKERLHARLHLAHLLPVINAYRLPALARGPSQTHAGSVDTTASPDLVAP